jgi:hypothetical protein
VAVSVPYLFEEMLREEWRMHSRRFGGRRFALFPAFLTLIAAGTAAFFAIAGASEQSLLAGLHIVTALVGLQVGSIGFVGREALKDLLGDTTLLIYSARTLPVEERRLLFIFVLKDVVYYAGLFIAPLVVGAVPLVVLGDLAVSALPRLLATAWLAFGYGVGLSLLLVGLATRTRLATAALAVSLLVGGVLRPDLAAAVTPYGLFADPSLGGVVASVAVPVAVGAVGFALFEFDRRTPARSVANQYRSLHDRLGTLDEYGLLAKSLLDVARSAGGLWKLLFSQGIVFGVVAVLLGYLPSVVPVRPSPGLTLAAVLSLGAFTTYNWLCQYEDAAFFGTYPVELGSVFRAKLIGYLLLAVPTGLFYLVLGAAVFGLGSLAVGAAVYLPVSLYVFGVTAYIAGLQPTELLFDTPVFAAFTVATMLVLLPLVVLAIAYPLAPTLVAGLAVGIALLAGAGGYGLYRRAGPRWTARARSGTLD